MERLEPQHHLGLGMRYSHLTPPSESEQKSKQTPAYSDIQGETFFGKRKNEDKQTTKMSRAKVKIDKKPSIAPNS